MKKVRFKKKALRRFSACVLSGCMAFIAILAGVPPLVARAYDYELVGSSYIDYQSEFSGIDDEMGNWVTNSFVVRAPDGNEYTGLCATPFLASPPIGHTFYEDQVHTNDVISRVLYWSIGNGWDDEDFGVLRDYSENFRMIIAHHTVAYALNDEHWNNSDGNTVAVLGDDSKIGYQLCMDLYSVAVNCGTGDWDTTATYLVTPDNYQNLIIYSESYNPPPPPPTIYTGSVKFHKKSSNEALSGNNSCYSLAGAEISIYSDADCTNLLTTLTTDANGDTGTYSVDFEEGDSVTLYYRETAAPPGFLINDEVNSITLDEERTYERDITDTPENDPVAIFLRKVNSETGSVSNGGGTLKGAKYVIKYYDVDMTTDPAEDGKTAKYVYYAQTGSDGRIRLEDASCYIGGDTLFKDASGNVVFPLGTLTIQEYEAPEGYLVDDTLFVNNTISHKIYVDGVEQDNATSYQEATGTIIHLEQEVKGKVAITKTKTVIKDDTKSAVATATKTSDTKTIPEAGAVFELYYKAAGSYDDATDAQRDILTTNSSGYAVSKDLPYGNYVLHQISGAQGCTFMEDKEVSISENGVTYPLSGTNIEKYSKIRLYKKGDVLTGYNSSTGFTYEERFVGGCVYGVYTDASCSSGSLVERITTLDGTYAESAYEYRAGTYYLKEISAAGGYILDSTVYPVTLTTDTDALVVTKAETVSDKRQKISITVNKTDADTDAPLSGAVFGVYASSDIRTKSGSVAVRSGGLIETVTTGSDGKAVTAFDYPIGYTYVVKEITSPLGYGNEYESKNVNAASVIGTELSRNFDLSFKDKHTSIVKTTASEYTTGNNQGGYNDEQQYKIIDNGSKIVSYTILYFPIFLFII